MPGKLPRGELANLFYTDAQVQRIQIFICNGRHIRWMVEAFPTWTEEVTKNLIKEIIPHFRISQPIQSDNGPGFTTKITLQVAKTLGINYSFHAAWRPQSSGKVEKMNNTLKQTIIIICQETQENWVQILQTTLMRIRACPHTKAKTQSLWINV